MSQITVDNILSQITQLPPSEQIRLRQLMDQQEQRQKPAKASLDKRVPPKSVPDRTSELQWILKHAREYIGQWIAIDGDRVIAHSPNAQEVFAAVEADGADLPLIHFVEDPDKHYLYF
jgi:hypothetical protein